MKYKHYAPKAEMMVIEGRWADVRLEIERLKSHYESSGRKVGVMLFEEFDTGDAARELFARLRELDSNGVDIILAGAIPEDGIGFAVMNRMLKAAEYNIKKV